jgi:hypothetical protein
MDKYGRGSGSSIPCRLVEDGAGIRLIDGEGEADLYPGNSVNADSHGGAFKVRLDACVHCRARGR